jgi:hypothetical protein
MTDLADKLPSEPMASASTSRSDRAWGSLSAPVS